MQKEEAVGNDDNGTGQAGVHTESPLAAMSAGYDQPEDPPPYMYYQGTDEKSCPAPPGQLPYPTSATYPSQYGAQSPLVDQSAYQPVVTQQPYNVVIVPPPEPAPSGESVCQLVWAVCNCLCCFWPLGLVAIIFAAIAVDSARNGSGEKARQYTKVALWLNVSSLIIGIIVMGVIVGISLSNGNGT